MSKPVKSILKMAESYWEQMKALQRSTGVDVKFRNAVQPPPKDVDMTLPDSVAETPKPTFTVTDPGHESTAKQAAWKPPASWNLPPPPLPKAAVEDPMISEFDRKLKAFERDPRIEEGIKLRNRQRAQALLKQELGLAKEEK